MKTNIKNLSIGLVAVGLSIFSSANAQTEKQIARMEKQALKQFRAQHYDNALAIYNQLDNMSSDQLKYDYMIGMCLMSSDAKEKALPYFRTAKLHEETSFVVNYYLGRSYMINENYAEAGRYLSIYKDSLISFMGEVNFKFKVKSSDITEKNRIHMEKTVESVNALISECSMNRLNSGIAFLSNQK